MMNNIQQSDIKSDTEHAVINGVKIGFADVIQEIRRNSGATPLEDGELYHQMDASLALSESSSYGAMFRVKAKSREEARDRAKLFLISRRAIDDTGIEIGWTTFELHYKPDTFEPEIEIMGDPFDEEAYLKQKREDWLGWVRDYKNGHAVGIEETNKQSILSEWKWPIILVPIIVALLIALEYISNQ